MPACVHRATCRAISSAGQIVIGRVVFALLPALGAHLGAAAEDPSAAARRTRARHRLRSRLRRDPSGRGARGLRKRFAGFGVCCSTAAVGGLTGEVSVLTRRPFGTQSACKSRVSHHSMGM